MAHGQNIAQYIDLEFVEIFVYGCVEEGFEFDYARVDFGLFGGGEGCGAFLFGGEGGELLWSEDEAELFCGCAAEAFFYGVDGAEDEFVDCVDYVVEEGL